MSRCLLRALEVVLDSRHSGARLRQSLDIHSHAAAIIQHPALQALSRRIHDHLQSPLLPCAPNVGRFAAQGRLLKIALCHVGDYIGRVRGGPRAGPKREWGSTVTRQLGGILNLFRLAVCFHLYRYARTWRGLHLGLSFASKSKGQCYTSPPAGAAVTQPAASIVIVCYNSAAYLPRCLKALSAQTFTDFEIIVIDNASPEGELGALQDAWPDFLIRSTRLATNVGFAAANNLGARMANAPWIALLNPDVFPEPDWLGSLILATQVHPNAFFASRQIQADRPTLLDGDGDVYFVSGLAQRRNFNVPYYPPGPPQEVFSACAAAALYPRQQFLDAGGFDEDYFAYHEDVDLGFRLRLRGLHCFLIPSAVVYHLGGSSSSRRSALATYYGHRNLVWTYVKDMPSPWFLLYLPLHIAWAVIAVAYFLLRGQGRAILRAKFDAIREIRAVLQKRRQVQSERRVKPGEVLRFMNRNPIGPLEGIVDRTWPAES